jgi:anti-sigma B factor antagonist
MATRPFAVPGLKLRLEENAFETIVHCDGKINAENSELFRQEICGLIPQSRGHVDNITLRIVLDLTNVTHVDSTGMGALLGAWTAAQKKSCDLEITNPSRKVGELVEMTKLDSVFKKVKDLIGGTKA